MDAQSPLTNSLQPTRGRSWIPRLRFRRKAFQEFSQSIDESLAALVARYPSPRRAIATDRRGRRGDLFQRRTNWPK